MWIFSESGFISVVRHRERNDLILVRSRDLKSLDRLSEISESVIQSTPYSDYPYRIEMQDGHISEWLDTTVSQVHYHNFKNHVEYVRGSNYAKTLASVWEIMHEVEDKNARND